MSDQQRADIALCYMDPTQAAAEMARLRKGQWKWTLLVVAALALPVVGVGLAIYFNNPAWLLLLFALVIFAT